MRNQIRTWRSKSRNNYSKKKPVGKMDGSGRVPPDRTNPHIINDADALNKAPLGKKRSINMLNKTVADKAILGTTRSKSETVIDPPLDVFAEMNDEFPALDALIETSLSNIVPLQDIIEPGAPVIISDADNMDANVPESSQMVVT